MSIKSISIYLIILAIAALSLACAEREISQMPVKNQMEKSEMKFPEKQGADGFDLISYFELDKALKGSPEFSLIYDGVQWYFSSRENRDKFKANARKYLPQFEEQCPYSLSTGKKIVGKPIHHKVVDGKLYFFYSKEYADRFEKDSNAHLRKARENWKNLSGDDK